MTTPMKSSMILSIAESLKRLVIKHKGNHVKAMGEIQAQLIGSGIEELKAKTLSRVALIFLCEDKEIKRRYNIQHPYNAKEMERFLEILRTSK